MYIIIDMSGAKKKVAILGCPRSGTSLTAHLVKSAGFDADHHGTRALMKPNARFNPDGYFERLDLVRSNDKLIHLINGRYNFLNPPTLAEVQSNNKMHAGAVEISTELNSYSGWFIKDSRLCFTLSLYELRDLHVIQVVRDPQSVKRSMIRHYGNLFEHDVTEGPHFVRRIDFDEYYKNVSECIDWQMSHAPSITVSYEGIMSGDVEILEEFIGASVDKSIINPGYRNYGM